MTFFLNATGFDTPGTTKVYFAPENDLKIRGFRLASKYRSLKPLGQGYEKNASDNDRRDPWKHF